MRNEEVDQVFSAIDGLWPNTRPLTKEARAMWGAELAKQDVRPVMAVLQKLATTNKYRPSLAEILGPIWAPKEASAGEAFANIWDAIGRRGVEITDLEKEAVRRMGGWGVLGQWQIDERHFHFQRFVGIWTDLLGEQRTGELRALAAVDQKSLPEETG